MFALTGLQELAGDRITASPAATGRATCAVRLIDRRTGAPHRINGRPLVIFTRQPDLAVAALLEGRDAGVWEARVERLEREAAS